MAIISTEESSFIKADQFIPERWMRESTGKVSQTSNASPFAFIPFGFGPRSCIGKRFAEMEIQILILR